MVLIHVLPAMSAVSFRARSGTSLTVRALALRLGTSLLVALTCVSLWSAPAIVSGGPDYRDAVLWTMSAGRMAHSFAHARPWWFHLAGLPVLQLPWILVPAIWRAGVRVRWTEQGLRLASVWSLGALALFSINSGKQVHYLIPDLPAVALVVARLTRNLTFRPLLPALCLFVVAIAACGPGGPR